MSPNFLICCGKTVCLMNEAFSADEAVTRFGLYIGTTCGDSMEPMIRQGRDRVCIVRCSGRLRLMCRFTAVLPDNWCCIVL